MRVRKFLYLLVGMALLVSCSKTTTPSEEQLSDELFQDAAEMQGSDTELYLASFRDTNDTSPLSDAALIRLGINVCAVLDSGTSIPDVFEGIFLEFVERNTAEGMSQKQKDMYGTTIAAVINLCPEYEAEYDLYISEPRLSPLPDNEEQLFDELFQDAEEMQGSDTERYLASFRDTNDTSPVSDAKVLEFGTNVCADLDSGISLSDMLNWLFEDVSGKVMSGPQKDMYGIIVAAVINLCPEYEAEYDLYISDLTNGE